MDKLDKKSLQREILLSFWKVHILYHAAQGPVVGQWMIRELNSHGYEVSPGTMYPLLSRMEKLSWLKQCSHPRAGIKARKGYELTATGREVLNFLEDQITELYREVIRKKDY